jgi:hypothetical protein
VKILLRLLTALVATGLIAVAFLLPQASSLVLRQDRSYLVDVEPLPLKIVCSGPMVEVAGESGVAIGEISRTGTARIWYQSSNQLPDVEDRSEQYLSITTEGSEQSTELLSAVQTQVVSRDRASGLLAGYCEQPTTAGWFVSGDGGVGRETVLVAANPNPVDTQMLLELHFAGKVVTERLVLAAESERLISLAEIVGVEPSYAIYFQSGGAPLLVALQHRYSDGLTPLGVALTTAIREPSELQWIGPVDILAAGYERPRLRIFAPGEAAEILVSSPGSSFEAVNLSLSSGQLQEVSLDMEPGTYLLRIESNQRVLAQLLNPSLTPLDYSWLSPLEALQQLHLPLTNFASELALVNPNRESISILVSIEGEGGVERSSIELSPQQLLMLPVEGSRVSLVSEGSFMAALRILDEIGYEVINPSQNQNPGQSLEVFVH